MEYNNRFKFQVKFDFFVFGLWIKFGYINLFHEKFGKFMYLLFEFNKFIDFQQRQIYQS